MNELLLHLVIDQQQETGNDGNRVVRMYSKTNNEVMVTIRTTHREQMLARPSSEDGDF